MLPSLLRDTPFRRYWLGQTISLVGDQVTLLALPLTAVLVLHAGPAEMGYLTAVALLPNLVFALHAGAWVDRRRSRRRVMIAADAGRALLTLTVPIAYWIDRLSMGQLYVVAFLAGCLSLLFMVSNPTMMVSLARREQYLQANSLVNGSRAFSYVIGPSIGGLLVQALAAPVALLVDAVSFVWSGGLLAAISPTEPEPASAEESSVWAGMRLIRSSRLLWGSLVAGATANFFNFGFSALVLLYAVRELHIRPGTLGLVLGVGAVGGVLGSTITARVAHRFGVGPACVAGWFIFTVPLLLVPFATGSMPHVLVLVLVGAAEFLSGLGVMILDISIGSVFQALVPDQLRSRFTGAYMVVNYGVRSVGALFGGSLGAAVGVREALWICTLGSIGGACLMPLAGFLGVRRLPDPLPQT
jgi:MFS family permease